MPLRCCCSDPLPATPANVAAARRYVEHLEANGGRLPDLKRVVIGGSAVPEAIVRGFRDEFGAAETTTTVVLGINAATLTCVLTVAVL